MALTTEQQELLEETIQSYLNSEDNPSKKISEILVMDEAEKVQLIQDYCAGKEIEMIEFEANMEIQKGRVNEKKEKYIRNKK